ncbi:Crp/Fnr family transcriptional regulator [Brevibacillus sp. SYSU BS000544]|uniref:Crp/Fnr family transcriptional regulator n=1 Tax=Brevibacillus sp. SYSU BS000544 TaxID=3416443 RepID=UPI003CE4EE8D
MADLKFFLKTVPIFNELSETEIHSLASIFTEKRFPKKTIIFLEGDPGEEMFVVKSGLIKIYQFEDAKEITLALFREGDYFGEMAVLQPDHPRSATAETLEPTTLYVLQRKYMYELLEKEPSLALKFLNITLSRLRKANEQIHNLMFLDSRSRIIKMIVSLAEQHGIPHKDGVLIDVKLTHQQIADLVGAVRETVTKILLELQKSKLLRIDQKRLLVYDMNKLKKHLNG